MTAFLDTLVTVISSILMNANNFKTQLLNFIINYQLDALIVV
jgi:hypothetical protein